MMLKSRLQALLDSLTFLITSDVCLQCQHSDSFHDEASQACDICFYLYGVDKTSTCNYLPMHTPSRHPYYEDQVPVNWLTLMRQLTG
jgi:hypothetical protein